MTEVRKSWGGRLLLDRLQAQDLLHLVQPNDKVRPLDRERDSEPAGLLVMVGRSGSLSLDTNENETKMVSDEPRVS